MIQQAWLSQVKGPCTTLTPKAAIPVIINALSVTTKARSRRLSRLFSTAAAILEEVIQSATRNAIDHTAWAAAAAAGNVHRVHLQHLGHGACGLNALLDIHPVEMSTVSNEGCHPDNSLFCLRFDI
jgi:hypothetical protein